MAQKQDRWHGKDKPRTDYIGVSSSHIRKDGTVIWRAALHYDGKVRIVGTGFLTDKEAAEAYDKFVEDNNLGLPLNKKGHRRLYLTSDEKLFIKQMSPLLSSSAIAKLIKRSKVAVLDYQKKNGLFGKHTKSWEAVLILDKRDSYEK